jgi:hypothetical protein
MNKAEAEKLGYKLIAASPFEVGLLKNGKGIRTWWCRDFGYQIPPLDHPEILRTIQTNEHLEKRRT